MLPTAPTLVVLPTCSPTHPNSLLIHSLTCCLLHPPLLFTYSPTDPNFILAHSFTWHPPVLFYLQPYPPTALPITHHTQLLPHLPVFYLVLPTPTLFPPLPLILYPYHTHHCCFTYSSIHPNSSPTPLPVAYHTHPCSFTYNPTHHNSFPTHSLSWYPYYLHPCCFSYPYPTQPLQHTCSTCYSCIRVSLMQLSPLLIN